MSNWYSYFNIFKICEKNSNKEPLPNPVNSQNHNYSENNRQDDTQNQNNYENNSAESEQNIKSKPELKRQFSRKCSSQKDNKKDSQNVIKPKNHHKKVNKKSKKSSNKKDFINDLNNDDDNHSSSENNNEDSNSSSNKETDQIKYERKICRHNSVNYKRKEIEEYIRDIIKKEKKSIHVDEMDKKRTEVSNLNNKSSKNKIDLKMESNNKNLDKNLMQDKKIKKYVKGSREIGSAEKSINNLWERKNNNDDNFGYEEIKELKQLYKSQNKEISKKSESIESKRFSQEHAFDDLDDRLASFQVKNFEWRQKFFNDNKMYFNEIPK